jgi:hypothetical protein
LDDSFGVARSADVVEFDLGFVEERGFGTSSEWGLEAETGLVDVSDGPSVGGFEIGEFVTDTVAFLFEDTEAFIDDWADIGVEILVGFGSERGDFVEKALADSGAFAEFVDCEVVFPFLAFLGLLLGETIDVLAFKALMS